MHMSSVVVLAASLCSGAAFAQSQPTPAKTPSGPHAGPSFTQLQQEPPPAPLFSALGVPFGVNAPVRAPYCNCAFRDFGGQPMTGRDAIVAQAIGHSDQ